MSFNESTLKKTMEAQYGERKDNLSYKTADIGAAY